MGIIYHSIMAMCGAYVIVEILQLHIHFTILKRKPFNCTVCTSGWLMLALSLPHPWQFDIPFNMACAMTITTVFNQLINRL